MTHQRIILETGMGTSLYRQDYTSAACRAIDDAIRHSSITMFASLGLDHSQMEVRVTVGVQEPEAVDLAAVAAKLPRGNPVVQAVKGGQNIPGPDGAAPSVVATVAVEAWLDIEPGDWRLSTTE